GGAVGGLAGGLTGGLIGGLGFLPIGGGDGGNGADTNLDLGTDIAGLDAVDDIVEAVSDSALLHAVVDPVEDIAGDVDVVQNLGLDLLGLAGNETDNGAGDTDITGLQNVDILGTNLLD